MSDLQSLHRPDGETLAFKAVAGDGPTVIWIGGAADETEGRLGSVAASPSTAARSPSPFAWGGNVLGQSRIASTAATSRSSSAGLDSRWSPPSIRSRRRSPPVRRSANWT